LKTGIETVEKFDYIFLAIGNSARDTFEMLRREGIALEAKPFAVGLRVVHRQRTIDRMQYGKFFKHPNLPPADYSSISADNLFLIGEGAGYAGGITSSAIDGINGALSLIERLKG